jgi:phosphoribosylamine--glycine ligase
VKTLVVGGGGREHALALALSRDPQVAQVYAAPGNPGMAGCAALHTVNPMDSAAVAALAEKLAVDLVVVGPEAPLVAGVADAVRERGIACFGPSAAAATLEGSKAFAKDVMAAAGVPTAQARVCTHPDEVEAALDTFGAPYVVKDDGLAAGKGVVVTDDRAEAVRHAHRCTRVLVEEYLDGPEVSLFAITDGRTVRPLQPAQDFKRALDGDAGPNTGGMGAYTPLPWAPADLVDEVTRTVLQPTVDEMAARGTPFAGLLYAGLALTSRGVRVVEFNARFGDPETQPLMALLTSPLGVVLKAAAEGRLDELDPLHWHHGAAVAVADPLEVLRGQQRHHGRAVDEAEQRHLRPVEVGLQEHRVAAVEERAGVRAGGVQVRGHHHALARGEPVVLDHVGRREAGQRGVEAGGVVDDLRRRRADARRRHHVLGERLGALDARGGGAGAEAGDARAADGVGDARHQRDLGADHDEVGRPALGQCRDGTRVGDVDAVLLGDRGRARVARRARQRGDTGVLRERENDRMLTSTGTDHEDAHDGTS